jgi:prevent-host-death family protein
MQQTVRVVGVRALQQNLSYVLDLAERGEIIRVTSRGRPKALIVSASAEGVVGILTKSIRRQARTEVGIREGWIRPSVVDDLPEIPERGFDGKTASAEALDADRHE